MKAQYLNMQADKIIELLKNNAVGVMPTDTIYGIVGSALKPETVERIYKLRERSENKPFIILISSLNDLNNFNIALTIAQKKFLKKLWPNPVSVVLPVLSDKLKYLHRGQNNLAFRMPKDKELLTVLKETGPLVAPSANFEGGKYAEDIDEAKKYFEDNVDFYIDKGVIKSEPSTIIQLNGEGSYKILRKGIFKVR